MGLLQPLHLMHDTCAVATEMQLSLPFQAIFCLGGAGRHEVKLLGSQQPSQRVEPWLVCQAVCCLSMSVCAEDELTVNCNNLMLLASADTDSSDAISKWSW